MVQALRSFCNGRPARRLVDLGAGDGRFLLRAAGELHPDWQGTHAVLLDHRTARFARDPQAFGALGWRTETRGSGCSGLAGAAGRCNLRRADCEPVPASLPRARTGGAAAGGGGVSPGVHRRRTSPFGSDPSSSATGFGSSAAAG